MSQLYLGRWEWKTDLRESSWQAPGGGASGLFDFRSLPQQAKAGGLPEGIGLFIYPTAQVHPLLLADLGTDPTQQVTPPRANAINALLGVSLTRDTFARMIRQAVFDLAVVDPTGQARWKPLRGRLGQRVQLAFPSAFALSWFDEPFSEAHPAHAASLAVFQVDYVRNREQGTPLDALRRWTGATMRALYGRMEDSLAASILPNPYKGDGWLPPQTTFTETWPTNGTGIATGQDQPWTERGGTDVEVSANQLRPVAADLTLRWGHCDTALATDDHEHSATATVASVLGSSSAGVAVRMATAAETYYVTRINRESGGPNLRRLDKVVTGTLTNLVTNDADPGSPVALKCKADASDISGEVGATTLGPTPDTAITGNLNVGYARFRNEVTVGDAQLDGHTAADITAAAVGGTRRVGQLAMTGAGL